MADPILLDNPGAPNHRYFGLTLALQGRHLVVGVGEGNPRFEDEPLTLLFERAGRPDDEWQAAAGFTPHRQPSRTQLSRKTLMIVATQIRYGDQTYLYEIP